MKPETRLRMKVMKLLRAIPNSWWESIQQKAIHGSPDVIGCVNGKFFAIEFKSESGHLSKLQELKLKKIKEAGGLSFVCDPFNYRFVIEEVQRLSNLEHLAH